MMNPFASYNGSAKTSHSGGAGASHSGSVGVSHSGGAGAEPPTLWLSSGFTLIELMTVICILALLMTASFGSLRKARELAKKAKAEAQLRELVNACSEYFVTYNKLPIENAHDMEVNASLLEPLTSADGNTYGLVFLNFSGTGYYNDPWGSAYRITTSVSGASDNRLKTVQEATIALPRRYEPRGN